MQIVYDNSNSLTDLCEKISSFFVYNNGVRQEINLNSNQFVKIKNNLFSIFSNARLEPAFGVSLHELTLNELKNGQWLELNFANEQTKNSLPFNSLLIKLENTGGFNLIRKYKDNYTGRCLYIALEKITDLTSVIN